MAEESQMNHGPAISPQADAMGEQNKRQQTGRRGTGQRQNVQSSGTRHTTGNVTLAKRVTGGEVLDDAKERLRILKQDTDDYVRRNPTKAVFTALGIGFVLGLMRRRH
jgi:ElaB/YqjD/DUF883 family membrane-anchored ribosome-binding protein